jgi:hypothetical protein
MPKGNPNPSPETRFKKGVSGNPGGKTKKHRQLEMKLAVKAARIRERMLSSLQDNLDAGGDALQFIEGATLKLIKDSEDRGFGTPIATVDNKSSDGSMTPTKITREIVQPKK